MMKKSITILIFLIAGLLSAQNEGTIQGFVLDKEVNNEPLPFAIVSVKGADIDTTTDLDGKHTLKVNEGTYTLVFNFPGYRKVEIPNIVVKKDKLTTIKDVVLSAMQLSFANDTSEKENPGSSEKEK